MSISATSGFRESRASQTRDSRLGGWELNKFGFYTSASQKIKYDFGVGHGLPCSGVVRVFCSGQPADAPPSEPCTSCFITKFWYIRSLSICHHPNLSIPKQKFADARFPSTKIRVLFPIVADNLQPDHRIWIQI